MSNEDKRDVMETASATTSPDNGNSGPFAYVVTAVALSLSILLSLAGAGCASVVLTAVAQDYATGSYEYPPDLDPYDNGFDDLLERYYEDLGLLDDEDADDSAQVVDVVDALDFDIAPYGATIDDAVSASSYAGTPTEVRDFVRDVLNSDRSYTERVARCLDEAYLNDQVRADKISEALDLCDEAASQIADREMPEVSGDDNGEVKDLLGTARSEAVHRWELMGREIGLLSGQTVDRNRLWDADEDVLEATEDAGDYFEDAMAAAAGR